MLIAHIGVVVESFSYVYQTTGGAKAVTREEMRAFKKIWAEFANPKTGFLERPQFVPFFRVSAALLDASCNSVDARSYRNWVVSLKSASIQQNSASKTS
jgi:hypothetical protein